MTNAGIITCQGNAYYFNQTVSLVGALGWDNLHISDGILAGQSKVDGAVQKVVSAWISCQDFVCVSLYCLKVSSRERRLYDTLCTEFYWPHMANDVFTSVSDCQSGPPQDMRPPHVKTTIASAPGPLESIEIDTLVSLPNETSSGHQNVLKSTNLYTKPAKESPVTKERRTYTLSIFVEHWVSCKARRRII